MLSCYSTELTPWNGMVTVGDGLPGKLKLELPVRISPRGRLWSHRDFKRLWFSDTVSQLGNQFTTLALPIMAVLQLRASAFEMGLLLAVQTIPFPILGLFVGVWADRLRKRPIMVICNLGRMATLASLPSAYFLNALSLYLVILQS